MEGRRVNHSAPKRNPLYVMFLCLVAAVFVLLIVLIVAKHRRFDGENTLCYFLWYGLGRFWIEGLRTDSLYLFDWTIGGAPIRVSQALSAVMVLVSAFLLVWNLWVKPHKPEELYVNIVAAREAAKAEETPEELTVEPEPENRYAELHFSDEDVYILACLVYHEARGESFEGQVAVVEVVLNRMLSDYFPDTVEEVVFQKYGDVWQFSPAPYLYSAEPDKEQYLAVHTAIEEREHILSEDTVYFSTAPYNESVDMIIGNHYFCKIF